MWLNQGANPLSFFHHLRAYGSYTLLIVASLLMARTGAGIIQPCGTDEGMRQLLGPRFIPWLREYRQLMQRIQREAAPPSDRTVVTERFVVPVVVHIIHDGGPSNISDAQVKDAIRLLNEIYQARHPDTAQVIPYFKPRIGNPNLEFRLARLDPEGNCTSGITRHDSPLTNSADDRVKKLPHAYWNADRYLNIWVVEKIAGGISGYAYFPCMAAKLEGVVVRNSYFGSVGTALDRQSRRYTLSHEVGHYLGLRHTYGYGNRAGPGHGNCDDDDDIRDTPLTEGSPLDKCDLYQLACPGSPDLLANVQNIMDYSVSCRCMFTTGQAVLIREGLSGGFACRSLLISDDNLLFTGVSDGQSLPVCRPVAWLVASGSRANQPVQYLTPGDSLVFHGEAYNIEADSTLVFDWVFAGGLPASSAQREPTVTYSLPGIYDVFLRVETALGSDTLRRVGYVVVGDHWTALDSLAAGGAATRTDSARPR